MIKKIIQNTLSNTKSNACDGKLMALKNISIYFWKKTLLNREESMQIDMNKSCFEIEK